MLPIRNEGVRRAYGNANILKISKKVKSTETIACSMEPRYGTYFSSFTYEDVRKVREGFERLANADEKTRKEFYDRVYARVGVYDENGNIAEEYRDLFPGKS